MLNTKLQNTRVIANANALISKTLERIEAAENRNSDDASLDTAKFEQSLSEVQQLGHLLLAEKISKVTK